MELFQLISHNFNNKVTVKSLPNSEVGLIQLNTEELNYNLVRVELTQINALKVRFFNTQRQIQSDSFEYTPTELMLIMNEMLYPQAAASSAIH